MKKQGLWNACFVFLVGGLLGCVPRVEVAPPQEPITINLNVKIEHEVKVRVEKELEEAFSENSEIF